MSRHQPPAPLALADLLSPDGFSILRRAAEALYDQRYGQSLASETAGASIHELETLLEELHIHQIELELQNESLRAIRTLLEHSLRRYEELYHDAPVALLTLSDAGTIREANQSLAILLDQPLSTLPGRRLALWISEAARPAFDALLADVRAGKKRLRRELSLTLANRPARWVLAETAPTTSALGDEIRLALIDISERKALEEQLRQGEALRASEERFRVLNAELEARVAARTAEVNAANAAKSHFLAHMSHEIRTPLNVILGLAQLLEQDLLDEPQQHQVQRIQEAGANLLAILNDILDLSKIEAGKLTIEHQPFELDALLARLASLQGRCAHAKGLPLRIESPTLPGGILLGDRLRLEQILNNLISNAIKFTETGHVDLRIQIRDTDSECLRLHFEVEDTGIGIEPQVLGGLFQPFTQADASITRSYGGTGLGLAISKHLVELMGGEIGAASQPGQGSRFWFDLPFRCLDQELDSHAPPPAMTTESTASPLAGWRVLVVDDSRMNQEVAKQALTLAGATVTLADDGTQALQRLRSADPGAYQAVLMDVQMPVMDGLTATRLIRQELRLRDLPIIGLSAGVLPQERQAALEAGMNEMLNKPVWLKQMIATLLQWAAPAARMTPPSSREAIGPTHGSAETFPIIPGIDREQAAEILCGNRTMFLNLLGLLVPEGRDLVRRVRQALAQGQRQEAAARLHNLKANAGSLGALDIVALAKQLEAAIDRGEDDLAAGLEELDQQLQDLIGASLPYLKR